MRRAPESAAFNLTTYRRGNKIVGLFCLIYFVLVQAAPGENLAALPLPKEAQCANFALSLW
jgi:hypothetical protein